MRAFVVAADRLSVSAGACAAYEEKKDELCDYVNRELAQRPDIGLLTGGNPPAVMFDNHRHHVHFMINVFKFSLFEMLAAIVPWVYKSYHHHGFAYDYFLVELKAWKDAVYRLLYPAAAGEIAGIYDWLIDNHRHAIALSKRQGEFTIPLEESWRLKKNIFLSHLLAADYEQALRFSRRYNGKSGDIQDLYLKIIQPALYDLGNLWEGGKISVAEEHLATAIVGRITADVYRNYREAGSKKAKAVVTSLPNEFHEVGARIVADFLEMDGWNIYYLGANVPEGELLKLVRKIRPKVLALSCTMPFNLDRAAAAVNAVRQLKIPVPKIVVVGLAFNMLPDLYRQIGADFWAPDAKTAVETVRPYRGK